MDSLHVPITSEAYFRRNRSIDVNRDFRKDILRRITGDSEENKKETAEAAEHTLLEDKPNFDMVLNKLGGNFGVPTLDVGLYIYKRYLEHLELNMEFQRLALE
ncbi:hypothetical protein R3I93_009633 [Phoxinus phoxinus]|uniref:Uncharacterized protein n=1 Tax=Phoxinus phoxinus TaxID=58324 RepID=A0AAN9D4C3_9TELE